MELKYALKIKKGESLESQMEVFQVEIKSVLDEPTKEQVKQMEDYADFLEKTPGHIVSTKGRELRIFNRIYYYFSNFEAAKKMGTQITRDT